MVPTPSVRAHDFEHELRGLHEALKAFDLELRQRYDQNPDEQTRLAAVTVAIEHLQAAIDALELASRE